MGKANRFGHLGFLDLGAYGSSVLDLGVWGCRVLDLGLQGLGVSAEVTCTSPFTSLECRTAMRRSKYTNTVDDIKKPF